MLLDRGAGGDRVRVVGPESCDDHKTHTIGCLDCAMAVAAAHDDDLDEFLARMEDIGWPEVVW